MDAGSPSAATAEPPVSETFPFQAEVSRVMHLIINSLYSDKEIFLRELISNAADACDKKRFLALSGGEGKSQSDLEIRVKADKDSKTVTIEDSGVGMTRQELISNLGSIATSGTTKFLDALGDSANSSDISLIGQFGVGFYSAYLVADKVIVTSKSFTDPEAKQYTWQSTADSSFTVTEDREGVEGSQPPLTGSSGTRIVLHIKDDSKDYLENFRLTDLVKRYSEFISFPILSWVERTEMEEVPDGDEKDENGKPKTKRVPKTIEEWTQANKVKPIWMRRPREVKKDEYNEFYKTVSRDYQDPLAHIHFAVEGDVEFRAILFTPKIVPMELRQNMFDSAGRMMKLYVKRVFISDSFDDILPRWLSFLRGVIDSDDLPLNVSREILQKSRILHIISKRLIRKSMDMFNEIKKRDNNDYKEFWKEFGRYLKAGIVEGADYKDDLAKLSLWSSTNHKTELTDLYDYVSRTKENQESIFFVAASSRSSGESTPAMEKLRSLGYEVLFLLEPVDEIAVQNMQSFKAKRKESDEKETEFKFVDVSKDDLNLDNLKSEDEKAEEVKATEDMKPVVEFMTNLLQDKIGKVRVSDRLTESVSTITQSSYSLSPTMERYMKEVGAGGMNNPGMGNFAAQSRTLDINPKHPIIKDMKLRLEGATGGDDESLRQTSMLVYELALLTGGYDIADSGAFARRVSSLVSSAVTAPHVPMPEPSTKSPDSPNPSDVNSILEKAMGEVEASENARATSGETDSRTNQVLDALEDSGVSKADVEVVPPENE